MVFVCPVSKVLNLQVIESKTADSIIEGITRLGCEVGFPTHFLVDQDAAVVKVMKEAQVDVQLSSRSLRRNMGSILIPVLSQVTSCMDWSKEKEKP